MDSKIEAQRGKVTHRKSHSQDYNWESSCGTNVILKYSINRELLNCVCSNKVVAAYLDFKLASN